MPGMMDTVLDIGLDDAVTRGRHRADGQSAGFAFRSVRRLIQMFRHGKCSACRRQQFEDVWRIIGRVAG